MKQEELEEEKGESERARDKERIIGQYGRAERHRRLLLHRIFAGYSSGI